MKKIIIAGILILAARTIYKIGKEELYYSCLLYTSDAADEL